MGLKDNKYKNKTILYIVHNYTTFQKDPIEYASKYFKKVYVLVRYKPISRIVKWIPIAWFQKYDDSNCINLDNLPKNVEVIRTPVWYLPYGFLNKLLGQLHYASVKRAIKKHKIRFDIVHSHFIWSSGYVGMRLKREYKTPFIVTGHGYDAYDLPYRNDDWKSRILEILDNADLVLTLSKYMKDIVAKLGVNSSKIRVLNNGYRKELFYLIPERRLADTKKELKLPNDKRLCLSVGNLEKIKGHKYLIEAFGNLGDEYRDLICIIIGAGSQKQILQNQISDLGLEERVHLFGFKKHSNIVKWMNCADVFVIPSINEGASVVAIESLACGTPVVGTKVGIIPDLIDNKSTGFLVDIKNPKDMSEKISMSISKDWDRVKISKRVEEYTWEGATNMLMEYYSTII